MTLKLSFAPTLEMPRLLPKRVRLGQAAAISHRRFSLRPRTILSYPAHRS